MVVNRALVESMNHIKDYLTLNIFGLKTRLWLLEKPLKYYLLKLWSNIYRNNLGKLSRLRGTEALIGSGKFNMLIILDACRYDIFSYIIHEFLDGKLEAALSPASVTIDWLKRIWISDISKDIVYVSASPMVNKRGLLKEFDASAKFLDVVEVWDWGWDENLVTVPPENVNTGVRIALTKMKLHGYVFPKDYKLVVHYVQPHAPYRALQHLLNKVTEYKELRKEIADIALRKLGRFTGRFSIDYILLGMLKEKLESEDSIKRIIKLAYIDNLRWVLRNVCKLVSHLDGRIIITADHGELLGEYGLYFHMDLPLPQLRIVPWFIVK